MDADDNDSMKLPCENTTSKLLSQSSGVSGSTGHLQELDWKRRWPTTISSYQSMADPGSSCTDPRSQITHRNARLELMLLSPTKLLSVGPPEIRVRGVAMPKFLPVISYQHHPASTGKISNLLIQSLDGPSLTLNKVCGIQTWSSSERLHASICQPV